MKKTFFTPGPTQIYPTIAASIQAGLHEYIASISHRSKEFENLFSQTVNNLRQLFAIPKEYSVFFVSSGTEAMERIIENCVETHSFHFINGSFSKRFYEIAGELKKKPSEVSAEYGEGFDILHASIPPGVEMICLTHNETSTGVMLPLPEIYALKKQYPRSLIALDIVSSAPYTNLDFRFLDCVFFSVQKGFGLPAGLGILIISPQAMEKSVRLTRKGIMTGSYHSFNTLSEYALKHQTPETPPVFHIYLLNAVITHMLDRGIDNIRRDMTEKKTILYQFLDSHPILQAFVTNKKFRSSTVIVMQTGEHTTKLRQFLFTHHLIVGEGYGKYKNQQLRVANFPATSLDEMKQLVTIIKAYYQK